MLRWTSHSECHHLSSTSLKMTLTPPPPLFWWGAAALARPPVQSSGCGLAGSPSIITPLNPSIRCGSSNRAHDVLVNQVPQQAALHAESAQQRHPFDRSKQVVKALNSKR
jgi:hypothetical protein